jgi:hypothetical protein
MSTKLTTEYIDNMLALANLRRIGHYFKSSLPMKIQCMICEHERDITVASLLNRIRNGSKPCPACAGLLKLTDSMIDNRLKERPIRRLTPFVADLLPMLWECTSCLHQWSTRVTKVLNENTGCPKCSYDVRAVARRLTTEMVEQKLLDRPLKLITPYEGGQVKATWSCLICNHTWKACPDKVINSYTGCPHCAPDGRYGRKVIRGGKKFGSTLEYNCYQVLCQFFDKDEIIQQVRYPHNSRMTADFVIHQATLWVEVSSIKTHKYLNNIAGKQKVVESLGNTFIFAKSPGNLRKQLEYVRAIDKYSN